MHSLPALQPSPVLSCCALPCSCTTSLTCNLRFASSSCQQVRVHVAVGTWQWHAARGDAHAHAVRHCGTTRARGGQSIAEQPQSATATQWQEARAGCKARHPAAVKQRLRPRAIASNHTDFRDIRSKQHAGSTAAGHCAAWQVGARGARHGAARHARHCSARAAAAAAPGAGTAGGGCPCLHAQDLTEQGSSPSATSCERVTVSTSWARGGATTQFWGYMRALLRLASVRRPESGKGGYRPDHGGLVEYRY